MLRYFAALLCLLSTFSQAQTISVITPPALPSGVWSQGGAYTTTVTLKNSGPSYLASEVADVGAANIAAVAEGRVVPYVYRFELVNLSTGSEDGALFTYGSTNATPNTGDYFFPSGANHSWSLTVHGGNGTYPAGGTYTYSYRFRVYDSWCSLSENNSFIHPSCIIYELPLNTQTVTWTPASTAPTQAPSSSTTTKKYRVLQTVTVVGSHINFNNPTSYSPEYTSSEGGSYFTGGMQIGDAILQAKANAINMADACLSPVSSGAKQTTSQSDVTSRWLAAQEMFNVVQSKNLWSMYRNATSSLTFIMNGKDYAGFKVKYADGFVEAWAVYPGYSTSTIKLLDQPMPNSLKDSGSGGCKG